LTAKASITHNVGYDIVSHLFYLLMKQVDSQKHTTSPNAAGHLPAVWPTELPLTRTINPPASSG